LEPLPPGITRFDYDRSKLTPSLAHIGVGGFHRSHQAVYVDQMLGAGLTDWAYWGLGLLPGDSRMRDALAAQDFGYTVLQNLETGERPAHWVRSILGMDVTAAAPFSVMARLTDPAVRIVTLTITEGGYNISDSTGEFDVANPAVLADLDPAAPPKTVFRHLAEALARRRDQGARPFTVVSCDNIPGNGAVARQAVCAFAELFSPGLGDWIAGNVAFPSSMVDRITPATADADRDFLRAAYGFRDRCPVPCEPFSQWVLEDVFPAGRPPFEAVGVQLTSDVTPYENMKLRLLNGAHQGLGHFGLLLGDSLVDKTANNPAVCGFLRGYFAEAAPTLGVVPGVDLGQYTATLLSRFANPYIKDTNARLATDASDRIGKFVLPVVRARLAAGEASPAAAAIVAAWARRVELAAQAGDPEQLGDRRSTRLVANWDPANDVAFLRDPGLFGALAGEPRFTDPYLDALRALRRDGPRGVLAALSQGRLALAGPS
jgi:mannitol 2-dehydrogenase